MIPQENYQQALKAIAAARSIVITATASADGDSIGAQLALYGIIQQLKAGQKYQMVILNEEACPKRYAFLPGAELVKPLSTWRGSPDFELGFVLDGGSERTGVVQDLFEKCPTRVLVDHHQYGSERNYEIRLHDPVSSSTAEIVYNFFNAAGATVKLTADIAANLYLALIFDTGFFRFSLTTPATMQMGAKLIATGIDFPKIAALGMAETSVSAKRMLGEVLRKFKIAKGGKVAWATLSLAQRKKFKAGPYDHEGIIENLCYLEGVEAAFLALELPKREVKISFRSREYADVGGLARRLGGGGHTRASGCTLQKTSLLTASQKVLKELKSIL